MSNGIWQDAQRAAEARRVAEEDSTLMVCPHCGGTGNEFYSMYRQCPQCGGVGVVDCVHDGGEG